VSVKAQTTETVMANHSTSTITDGLRSFATLGGPGFQSPLVRNVCDVSGTNNIQGPSALTRGVQTMKAFSLFINMEHQSQRITAISDKGFKGNSPALLSRATVKVPGTLSNAAPLAFKSALSSLLSHEP